MALFLPLPLLLKNTEKYAKMQKNIDKKPITYSMPVSCTIKLKYAFLATKPLSFVALQDAQLPGATRFCHINLNFEDCHISCPLGQVSQKVSSPCLI